MRLYHARNAYVVDIYMPYCFLGSERERRYRQYRPTDVGGCYELSPVTRPSFRRTVSVYKLTTIFIITDLEPHSKLMCFICNVGLNVRNL